MPLIRGLRQGPSKSLHWAYPFCIVLVLFLFVASTAYSQVPVPQATPPAKTESPATPAASTDPLGRDTPRGAMMGFLRYAGRNDFETAARYLESIPKRRTDLVQYAKELQALDSKLKINITLLSNDPTRHD